MPPAAVWFIPSRITALAELVPVQTRPSAGSQDGLDECQVWLNQAPAGNKQDTAFGHLPRGSCRNLVQHPLCRWPRLMLGSFWMPKVITAIPFCSFTVPSTLKSVVENAMIEARKEWMRWLLKAKSGTGEARKEVRHTDRKRWQRKCRNAFRTHSFPSLWGILDWKPRIKN